jgi:hypothetical protein
MLMIKYQQINLENSNEKINFSNGNTFRVRCS